MSWSKKTIRFLRDEDDGGLLRIRRVQEDAAIVEREAGDGSWEAVDDRLAMRCFERALLSLTDAVEELQERVKCDASPADAARRFRNEG